MAGLLLITGCAGASDDSGGADQSADAGSVEASAATMAPAEEATALAVSGDESPVDLELGAIGRDVIIEMSVMLRTDDVKAAVSSISTKVATAGGGVASSDVNYAGASDDDERGGHATLMVKVPPEAAQEIVTGLESLGTIENLNQHATDVTEQLVDLDVRIENARESVDNVRGFMDRTKNINELVKLEGELTRRQTELEQLLAQERNLSERVAMSTITIDIVSSDADPDNSIGGALERGWDAFLTVMVGLGLLLATLLPFIVTALIVLWIVRRVLRWRQPAVEAPAPDASADA